VEPRHDGVTWRGRFGVGPVAPRAGKINDDLRLFIGRGSFEDDGAVGMEELVGDVGEDGGAAGGNAAFGDKDEEAGEELADVRTGGEFGKFGEKFGREVFRVVLWRLGDGGDQGGVAKTEIGASIQNTETAAATVGGEMAAAWMIGGAGLSGSVGHFWFLFWRDGVHPPSK